MTPETLLTPLIPVTSLRRWRKDGLLCDPQHWQKVSYGIAYTPAGMTLIRGLVPGVLPEDDSALQPEESQSVTVSFPAVVRAACVNRKYLRAVILLADGSRILASVRLTHPQASASRFRIGARITVQEDTLTGSAYQCAQVKA